MARLRAGVIGAGSWAVASHIPNLLKRSSDVALGGFARPEQALIPWIAEQFGFERGVTDHRELLEMGLDVCIVSSPNRYHYEHAKAALEAGAHVMVEKPFTIDPRRCLGSRRHSRAARATSRPGARVELQADGRPRQGAGRGARGLRRG